MPGLPQQRPGSVDPGPSWRALAELITEVHRLLRQPSVAGAAMGPLGPLVHDMSVSVGAPGGRHGGSGGPDRPRRLRRGPHGDRGEVGRTGDGAEPSRANGASSSVDALLDGAIEQAFPGPVADEHAESWRLVRAAQAGDGEAFGQLYDRYVDTVYRFIYFRVSDRGLAEDFTSETFLRALRRIGSINYQGRDIGAWFVTIARNIVFDHTKSARHRLEISIPEPFDGDDRSPGPEAAVISQLTSARLMAAVGQLGDEQRECVLLRFVQGFSVSETAEVMGKNDGAIKALQHRAIRKLAELVGDELR